MKKCIGVSTFLLWINSISLCSWAVSSRPPQYVVVSFDGSKSINMWKQTRQASLDTGAKFTYFLSGVYFLQETDKKRYLSPGRSPGRSDIGFGKNLEDLEDRVFQVDGALSEGAEMGSHANGHFDGGKWSYEEWKSEFEQFYSFVAKIFLNYPKLNLPAISPQWEASISSQLRGFRAPLLANNKNSDRVLTEFGYDYDASRVAAPSKWPYKLGGLWQFPLATIPIAGTAKKTISMDYNFYFHDSKAQSDAAHSELYQSRYYLSLLHYFQSNYYGNRAPVHIGNHFSTWNQGAYFNGLIQFVREVCGNKDLYPEVQCINYKSLVTQLNLAGDKQIQEWEKGLFPKVERTSASTFALEDQELDLELDLRLVERQLNLKLSGRHKLFIESHPDLRWTMSSWNSPYSVTDREHLSLPPQDDEAIFVSFGTHPPNLNNLNLEDGTRVLRIGLEMGGQEIQSITKRVTVLNGQWDVLSSFSEEALAAKGDLPGAHTEE